ncbi:hypothetical protein diail_8848 [Diaporthe ilicicola]|nr:hypothetical protein diail_8848 [Diaporthe ilicicola]
MSKGKTRGGPRKPRQVKSLAGDVEMKDLDLSRNEKSKSRAKKSNPKPKSDLDRRGRVGKQVAGAEALDGWRLRTNSVTIRMPRARSTNQRLSIFSAASSTLSTQNSGPWCDKCSKLNRQLHGYLLEILKDGEDAIDEWAYAVGASPDQMECEPAPERIIPEGYRRYSRQYQLCTAKAEYDAGTPGPPVSFGWPGTALPGGHQGQSQHSVSRYSQLSSELAFAQRTHEPISTASSIGLQNRQTLVAIPEHEGSYAQRAKSPSQTLLPVPQPLQPPWNGTSQHVAVFPGSGLVKNTPYNWTSQQPRVPTGSSGQNHQQNMETMRNMPMIGTGRALQGAQDASDGYFPE